MCARKEQESNNADILAQYPDQQPRATERPAVWQPLLGYAKKIRQRTSASQETTWRPWQGEYIEDQLKMNPQIPTGKKERLTPMKGFIPSHTGSQAPSPP